jgi:hypothetical protein
MNIELSKEEIKSIMIRKEYFEKQIDNDTTAYREMRVRNEIQHLTDILNPETLLKIIFDYVNENSEAENEDDDDDRIKIINDRKAEKLLAEAIMNRDCKCHY